MRGILAGVAIAVMTVSAAQGAERRVEGYVDRNNTHLELQDGFALRGTRGEKITVYLFPVGISDRDIEAARAGQPWAVALRKSSPDPQRWDWCPTVEIDLRSVNGALEGRDNLEFANFMFNGLERRNHTVNLTRSGDQVRATITELSLREHGGQELVTLSSRVRGLAYDDQASYSWQISATLPVYEAADPDAAGNQ